MKIFRAVFIFIFVVIATSSLSEASPEKFSLDKNSTYVGFDVSYLLFLRITGRFDDFDGAFVIDREHPENNRADIIIKTASIDTGVESRNDDIRGPALFDVDKYPDMIFHSDKIELGPENTGLIKGKLTLRGVTNPVTLDLIRIPDVEPQQTIEDNIFADGFMVTGKIKRSDFGMNDFIRPIGDVVTLFVCYKLEKCNSIYTQQERTKTIYKYNQ